MAANRVKYKRENGRKPVELKRGCAMNHTMRYASPLGELLLASDGEALIGVWFAGQAHFALGLGEHEEQPDEVLHAAARWLGDYFAGKAPGAMPKLRPRGTDFQKAVWRRLTEIPRGETTTYGAIAAALRSSARAVGGAVGRNPISILIPCHRVMGANGSLTGYAGGIERKTALLKLEGTI